DIRLALVELLKEIPYEKVTVKLVSERALVARPTFYAHYTCIQDILVDFLQDLFDTASSTPNLPTEITIEALEMYFVWIKGLREIIDLLYKNNLESLIYKLNRKHIYYKELLQPSKLEFVPKEHECYKKYVELMGGILFSQVISLVEENWEIEPSEMARSAFNMSIFIVDDLLENYFGSAEKPLSVK
ncbi:MAG: hypothetical protein RRZ69_04255, partial [Clostridia bacterium]